MTEVCVPKKTSTLKQYSHWRISCKLSDAQDYDLHDLSRELAGKPSNLPSNNDYRRALENNHFEAVDWTGRRTDQPKLVMSWMNRKDPSSLNTSG